MNAFTSRRLIGALAGAAIASALSAGAAAPPYDPLAISSPRKAQTLDLTAKDAKRGREIPLRVYLPAAFWDARLREDSEARAWLDGADPSSVLERQDRWQKK